ncbi:SPOR domain-containing protein [Streptomyces sp. ODS28]|uniref:SPOR domain-containing protein n=1 Tax=Streptomyces sp. ODS28 TaxID=3136688 RepID=UPI0031EC3EE5
MRSVRGDGDSNAVLPWHVIRQEANGNRYRVGSYATRAEAQLVADRLTKNGDHDPDSYLVERMDLGGGREG